MNGSSEIHTEEKSSSPGTGSGYQRPNVRVSIEGAERNHRFIPLKLMSPAGASPQRNTSQRSAGPKLQSSCAWHHCHCISNSEAGHANEGHVDAAVGMCAIEESGDGNHWQHQSYRVQSGRIIDKRSLCICQATGFTRGSDSTKKGQTTSQRDPPQSVRDAEPAPIGGCQSTACEYA
ncbi:hypothetical protein B0H10DRAFT_2199221 [Mycena sp. CBHHK59/15]|nr:hypothetical protein B0H10DRAFT_2199221 [Mycena sp. CBHHK59/15]